MTLDEELERQLRHDMQANATTVAPRPDLAIETISEGRRALLRRRLATGLVLGVVAVSAGVVSAVVMPQLSRDVRPPEPADTVTTTTSVARISPLDWATSLPSGPVPEVPYLVGVNLHLPGGKMVELEGSGAGIIGASTLGTILLVETEVEPGVPFSSRFVVVAPDGQVADLPISTLTPVQEAVISPDGALFAAHRNVVRLDNLAPVATIPDNAELLVAWTPSGVVYNDHSTGYYLWEPGQPLTSPIKLAAHPGVFPNGTDIGLRQVGACSQVVQIRPDGAITVRNEICDDYRIHTVSPTGRWAITRDLQLVDLAAGSVAPLDGAHVSPIHVSADSRWITDDVVLLTITQPAAQAPIDRAVLVRCQLTSNTCERTTRVLEVPLTQGNIGLP